MNPTARSISDPGDRGIRRVDRANSQGGAGSGGSWRATMPALAAALAALLVYACTLRGTYIYDDIAVVRDDPRLTNPHRWHQFWTWPYMPSPDKLYRPLVSLSFAVQRVWTGERAWPLHMVNWLLHAAVAAGVAELGRRLAGLRTAWAAGLLFAVHPVHVEPVATLVGRTELLCALATVVGLCTFLGGGERLSGGRILAIGLCCVVALLSKEPGMLFPALVLALVPLRRARPPALGTPGTPHRASKGGLWLTVVLCYTLAGYVLARELTLGFGWDRVFLEWVMNPMVRSHGADRALLPLVLAGRYLVLLVAPHRQSIDYGGYAIGWRADPHDPYLYLGALAVVMWATLLIATLRRRNWAAVFCLIGFAMTYAMIGNIVALIGTIFADRLMYLPSVFFLLLVGMGLSRLPRATAGWVLAALVVTGGWRAYDYARLWSTPTELFTQCVKNQPKSERGYRMLGTEYKKANDWFRAREVARAGMAAVPDGDGPYELCMEADVHLRDRDDALRTYDRAMGLCTGIERLYLVQYGGEYLAELNRGATQPSN